MLEYNFHSILYLNTFKCISPATVGKLFSYCRLSVVQRFNDDQVDCMCEALLQQYPGSRSRLVTLISSLSSLQLRRYDSEHLLRARAVVAFHTGRFTDLYTILTGSHVFHPAHHQLLQKVIYPIERWQNIIIIIWVDNRVNPDSQRLQLSLISNFY